MRMKGKAKIQLFDAKTGKLTDEVESDNLVTNFFNNIFNENLQAIERASYGLSRAYGYYIFTNLVTDLMGGVMIFSDSIEEDPDHVFPTGVEAGTEIGSADQGSGIVGSSFSGVYNELESVITDKYATLVWDFGTSVCNGDIAAICLTSKLGGRLGCRYDVSDTSLVTSFIQLSTDSVWLGRHRGLTDAFLYVDPVSYSYNTAFSVCSDTAMYVFVRDGTIKKVDINLDRVASFSLSDGYGPLTVDGDTYFGTWDKPSNFYGPYVKCLDEQTILIEDRDEGLLTADSWTFYLIKGADVEAGATMLPAATTVQLANYAASYFNFVGQPSGIGSRKPSRGWYYKGQIIVIVSVFNNTSSENNNTIRMYKINMDGSFVYKDIKPSESDISRLFGNAYAWNTNWDSETFGVPFMVDDDVYIRLSNRADTNACLYVDVENMDIDFCPRFYCNFNPPMHIRSNTVLTKAPLFLADKRVSGYNGSEFNKSIFGLTLMPQYLATINNISPVLTKTPDKVMKIVYTLTHEE